MNRFSLGKRLREERIQCGMTQEQVAESINVSTTYIGLIERGERSVTLEKLVLLAQCFHVTIDFLLQDSVAPTETIQDRQLLALWNAATEQQRDMILSIIQSVIKSPQQK
ncbi:XRE family transcriptional regulator [bacterium 1XD8-76]|nr:XRE family transcriptional regulator [bacterium 1XD8-76]